MNNPVLMRMIQCSGDLTNQIGDVPKLNWFPHDPF